MDILTNHGNILTHLTLTVAENDRLSLMVKGITTLVYVHVSIVRTWKRHFVNILKHVKSGFHWDLSVTVIGRFFFSVKRVSQIIKLENRTQEITCTIMPMRSQIQDSH